MHFCPCCGNLLLIEEAASGSRFCCPTCPYVHDIRVAYKTKTTMPKKQVDDILGGDTAWDNVDKTSATCPHCGHKEAYFMQVCVLLSTIIISLALCQFICVATSTHNCLSFPVSLIPVIL